MKKYSKIVALLLALAMVFALASCGGGKSKDMVYVVEAAPPVRPWPRRTAGRSTPWTARPGL